MNVVRPEPDRAGPDRAGPDRAGPGSGERAELTPQMCISGRDLTEPKLSLDGRLVAVVVRWGSMSGLVVVPAGGGPERLLPTAVAPAPGRGLGGGCFDWTPDGAALVHAGADGGLWWQPIGAGSARCLARHEGASVQGPAVAPDGTFVVYAVDQAQIWRVWCAGDRTPERLDDGSADFCFDPVVSDTSDEVAWLAWNVPDMPWDGARVQRTNLGPAGGRAVVDVVADGAIQQPRWSPTGTPTSVRDDTGWLNVWLGDEPLVDEPCEHAGPTWGMGQRSYAVSPDGRSVAFTRNEDGFGRLCTVDVTTREVTEIARGVHGQLTWQAGRLAALRSGARTPTQVVVYDASGPAGSQSWARSVLMVGPAVGWERAGLPEPELVQVDGGGGVLHARRYVAGHGRTICWIHGGPTDQWQVEFMPRVAYWWSRGWDILVPDPRGSTGHGRSYQQALHGGWGRLDVDDTAAIIRASHERGWSTPAGTVVVGGSSGGLTALGVLGRHGGLAAAGAVSYPVTDLADLSERSHRFEAHYALSLVGPPVGPAAQDQRYRDSSPLSYAERIDVPLLVMHGDEDPVVPLGQSLALVERLRSAGRSVELHVMAGEGHGFRDPVNKLAEYRLLGEFLARVAHGPAST